MRETKRKPPGILLRMSRRKLNCVRNRSRSADFKRAWSALAYSRFYFFWVSGKCCYCGLLARNMAICLLNTSMTVCSCG